MRKAIRLTFSALRSIEAVYGFGSFFRGEQYRDIDLVFVLAASCEEPLKVFECLRESCRDLSALFGVELDATVLTSSEFCERPFRDMETLVKI